MIMIHHWNAVPDGHADGRMQPNRCTSCGHWQRSHRNTATDLTRGRSSRITACRSYTHDSHNLVRRQLLCVNLSLREFLIRAIADARNLGNLTRILLVRHRLAKASLTKSSSWFWLYLWSYGNPFLRTFWSSKPSSLPWNPANLRHECDGTAQGML